MMILGKNIEINPDFELLKPQTHENMAIIPIKTKNSYNLDLLTLKKGFELGLVNVEECERNVVNTVSVENKAVTPLLLVDGEEILGSKQNRIINSTILIAPNSKSNIPVSCTERGRWKFTNRFKQSDYIANYNTRRSKEYASRCRSNYQDVVWESIDELEISNAYASDTSAMSESYEHLKIDHDEFLKAFHAVPSQTGVVIMIDGIVKGFEIFFNSEIYKEYHEKILKSYLIDTEIKNTIFTVNLDEIRSIIDQAINSSFSRKDNVGLEDKFIFKNENGLGTLYVYKNEIIHWSYFKNHDEKTEEEFLERTGLKVDI